ncbi:MAG TPA: hypothetical protein VF775_02445 [Geobacteraceae bacterium]
MLGWLLKRPSRTVVFESNQAAFEFACLHQDYPILLEALIPALVREKGTVDQDGVRHFLLQLAGRGGGRELWSCTLREATDYPEVGELVGFRVVKIAPDLPEEVSVIGFIAVKLMPEWVEKRGWRVMKSYTPSNIKPTVRW